MCWRQRYDERGGIKGMRHVLVPTNQTQQPCASRCASEHACLLDFAGDMGFSCINDGTVTRARKRVTDAQIGRPCEVREQAEATELLCSVWRFSLFRLVTDRRCG